MTTVITTFPSSEANNPKVWRVSEGQWADCGPLSEFLPDVADDKVVALVSAAEVRCIWSTLPDLEPRQAEGVAKVRASEHSIGLVHAAARHIGDDQVVTATIAPQVMQTGLDRLALRGLNPDIVIPFGLAVAGDSERVIKAKFDGLSVVRGAHFAIPDEPVFRELLVGDVTVDDVDLASVEAMLVTASKTPLLNLREGLFAKRERRVWATAEQMTWIKRLSIGLVAVTLLLGVATLAKYWSATNSENDRALIAAKKIDPSIQDIAQAEAQLARALEQKGFAQGRFAPLSAALWRTVKASPNVSVRELRYGPDGTLVVVLAAPNADGINRTLIAIQQDGYRVTATPRQDSSGAMLTDLTMRMP